jgi:hypothetical protein
MLHVTTDFNRLSPTYSYVDLFIKMSASCTFCELLASYGHQMMVVQTFVVHTGHPAYNIIHLLHEYHVDIQWISVLSPVAPLLWHKVT